MHPGTLNSEQLLYHLSNGWRGADPTWPRELFARLKARLHAHGEERDASDDVFSGKLELDGIRLQGAGDLGCVLLGPMADNAVEVRRAWQRFGGPGRLVLVIGFDSETLRAAQPGAPPEGCVFLGRADLGIVLEHVNATDALIHLICRQVPLERLMPYQVTLPVEPQMFFGRRRELRWLLHDEKTSYAIAGPGRVGKTSLLHKYMHELRRPHGPDAKRDPRAQRLYDLSYYNCGHYTDDEVARHLARRFSGSLSVNRASAQTLRSLFVERVAADGGPLELLIDEVDEVCFGEVFQMLADVVRDGLCRLILCGRANLLRMMQDDRLPLAGRLVLLRPEPLDAEVTARLVREPFAHLGLTLAGGDEITQRIFRLSGGLPHLVQSLARQLVEQVFARGGKETTPTDLAAVEGDFNTLFHGLIPLKNVRDDVTRLAALRLLETNTREVNVGVLEDLLDQDGVRIDGRRALEICEDLLICNILAWTRSGYRLANEEIATSARRVGLLDRELAALRARLRVDPIAV